MALVDLRQEDQRDGEMASLAEPPIQLDRCLGRLYPFLVIAGQGTTQPGLSR
jgi:hypothetical protein